MADRPETMEAMLRQDRTGVMHRFFFKTCITQEHCIGVV